MEEFNNTQPNNNSDIRISKSALIISGIIIVVVIVGIIVGINMHSQNEQIKQYQAQQEEYTNTIEQYQAQQDEYNNRSSAEKAMDGVSDIMDAIFD